MMKSKIMKPIVTLFMLVVLSLLVFYMPRIILTLMGGQQNETVTPLHAVQDCDIQTASCSFENKHFFVTLDFLEGIEQAKVSPVNMVIQKREKGIKPVNMYINLKGKTMYMGENSFALKLSNEQAQGEVIVPVCTTEKMDWVMEVWLQDNRERWHEAIVDFSIDQKTN